VFGQRRRVPDLLVRRLGGLAVGTIVSNGQNTVLSDGVASGTIHVLWKFSVREFSRVFDAHRCGLACACFCIDIVQARLRQAGNVEAGQPAAQEQICKT
jgi:hypothetical protein